MYKDVRPCHRAGKEMSQCIHHCYFFSQLVYLPVGMILSVPLFKKVEKLASGKRRAIAFRKVYQLLLSVFQNHTVPSPFLSGLANQSFFLYFSFFMSLLRLQTPSIQKPRNKPVCCDDWIRNKAVCLGVKGSQCGIHWTTLKNESREGGVEGISFPHWSTSLSYHCPVQRLIYTVKYFVSWDNVHPRIKSLLGSCLLFAFWSPRCQPCISNQRKHRAGRQWQSRAWI